MIDSGASHSFVSTLFVKKLDMMPELLMETCSVSFPSGDNLVAWFYFKVIPVKIPGWEFSIDILVLELVDFDVILGIDWLSNYNANIFCKKKKILFQPSKEETFEYKGTPRRSKWPVVSTRPDNSCRRVGLVSG